MTKKQAEELFKLALAWSVQRVKLRRTSGLGLASCRAALCRRGDALQKKVWEINSAAPTGETGTRRK